MSSNSYAAEPVLPVLAHTLLSESISPPLVEAQDPGDWNLRKDIDGAFDYSSVFRCGTVLGFSKLRNKIHDDGDELIAQLPRYLLTKHLLNASSPPSSTLTPKAFIIHPATSLPFSPKALLASLLTILPRNEAITLLDHVQLLPVFDFAAALQAIRSVAATLHDSASREDEAATTPQRTLLLVAGLDTLAEGVIRASNPVRGAAALTTALRTLTQLARAHAGWVSVMLVNTSGLGSWPGSAPEPLSGLGSAAPMQDGGVCSAFHAETTLLSTLLMRTLDQGVDTHFLLSTVRMEYVVEVVKDRVGEAVGRWCVWERL